MDAVSIVRSRRVVLAVLAVLGALSACSSPSVAPLTTQTARVAAAGPCPEPRTTPRAPGRYYDRTNPLPPTADNLESGRRLFNRDAGPGSCASCHGVAGDGRGPAAGALSPAPRNFTCAATMDALSDGQLYWVIEHGSGPYHLPARQGAQRIERPGRGSPTVSMRGYGEVFTAEEVWQLVHYVRSLARDEPAESP